MNYENLLTWLSVAMCVVVLGYLAYMVYVVFDGFEPSSGVSIERALEATSPARAVRR